MKPDEYTIAELRLDVGDGHELYIQDWGNKDAAKPVIFLHGGPGGSVKDKHKANFNPTTQRVIFFDQRGGGQSTPYGSLEHNITDDLVEDITKIADHLGLDRFILHGGSWGSCLALAYGIKYPERVLGMVLHGIFAGSQAEIDWLDQGQLRTFFPDAWDRYVAATPEEHRADPSRYHFKRALGSNTEQATAACYTYEQLVAAVIKLDDRYAPSDASDYDPTSIRTEIHYLVNHCFMPDNYILDNADKLTMPVYLVQGRYDMVCPPMTAYALSRKLAKAKLLWTINGHAPERESAQVMRLLIDKLTQE